MRFLGVALDYDGTLATDGRVDDLTIAALQSLRDSGRRLVLVTGRELPELKSIFPQLEIFDRVVAENGALLYGPTSSEESVLAAPPSPVFRQRLHDAKVEPISFGRVIVATCAPHEVAVLEIIHELGLEMQVILNKGAVMVLPSGVNKATGLGAAVKELNIPLSGMVGCGDGENDHALLEACGFGVAVANAVPSLKSRADYVTDRDHGAGVVELASWLLDSDR